MSNNDPKYSDKIYGDQLEEKLAKLEDFEDNKKASNLKYNNQIKELKKQIKGFRNDRHQTVFEFAEQQEELDRKETEAKSKKERGKLKVAN